MSLPTKLDWFGLEAVLVETLPNGTGVYRITLQPIETVNITCTIDHPENDPNDAIPVRLPLETTDPILEEGLEFPARGTNDFFAEDDDLEDHTLPDEFGASGRCYYCDGYERHTVDCPRIR